MSKFNTIITTITVCLVVFVLWTALKIPDSVISLGSVGQTGEYQASTTVGMATGVTTILLSNVPGVLGSVIIASSSATTFRVFDATSTTDVSSTTKALFVAAPANGTYTFDINLTRGLIISLPTNFNGSYTVTYR